MYKNLNFLSAYKLAISLLGFSAIVTEIVILIERGVFNIFNFFSYFTILSNTIVVVMLLISVVAINRDNVAKWVHYLRAAAAVYLLIVGIGFSLLLSGVEGLVLSAVAWDNIVLHYIIPIAVLIDLNLDKPKLNTNFRQNITWLSFPIIYLAYSLFRGHLTQWYPYPFLSPLNSGYGSVLVPVLGLLVVGIVLIYFVSKLSIKEN